MGFANYVPNPQQQGSFMHMLTQPMQPMQQGVYMQPMQESPSQFNRQAYRLQDEKSSSDEADVVPETQPSPPPQSQTKSKKGKKPAKDKPAGKTPCMKWTVDEEVNVAKAWAETSEDPCTGNYQKKASFWKRVKASFDVRMKYDEHVRSVDGIQSKIKQLLSTVAQFACIYNNTLNTRSSGEGDADVLKKAQGRYRNTYQKNFSQHHAWDVLKDCPKFVPVKFLNPSDIHAPRPKRSKTSETDSPGASDAHTHYVNVDNDDDTEASERPRPLGRNAARRAGSSSTAGASSDNVTALLEQLNAYNAANNTYIEISSRNADVRYERQRSEDLKIYMESHAHLTGPHLELMLKEKERMRKKYDWPPLW